MIYRLGRLVSEVARAFSSVVKKNKTYEFRGSGFTTAKRQKWFMMDAGIKAKCGHSSYKRI